MKEWIEEFEKGMDILANTKQEEEHDVIFRELEWMKELTLDTWSAMDEQLEQWLMKKQEKHEKKYRSRGTAYYDLHMYEQAAKQFIIELRRLEHPTLRLYAGYSYMKLGQYVDAQLHFNYVRNFAENHQAIYLALCGLAHMHVNLKRYEEAIKYYEKALRINSHPDVVYNLGMCFFHINKPEYALPYIEYLLMLTPEDYHAYYLLGRCYLLLDDKERAKSAWLCALQLTTEKDDLLAIAFELEEMGYYLTAIHCYKRLLQCGHRENSIIHGLAWNYGLLDKRELSIKWFNKLFFQREEVEPTVSLSFVWLLKKWDDKRLISEYHHKIEQFIAEFPHYDQLLEK